MDDAVFVDGYRRGDVIATSPGLLTFVQAVPVLPDRDWFTRPTEEPIRPTGSYLVTYHRHDYSIGGRTFRIWSNQSLCDRIDEIDVIMTLIDLAPENVRRCEYRLDLG